MSVVEQLIRTSIRAYQAAPKDPAIELALDRTEPPIPYRAMSGNYYSSPTFWSRYPSPRPLEAQLARRHNIQPENVIVTAGADEALDRACRAALTSGNELLTTTPAFEMIAKYACLAAAEIADVPWLGGEFPIADFLDRISSKTRLIILVSPNNPTGQSIPSGMLERIARESPNILIVVDLAYVEFAEIDPTLELSQFPNIVIVRSFSKAWGLPGLRLGYALGDKEVIQAMRAAGGPYSVAAGSMELLSNRLEQFEGEMLTYVARIKRERAITEEWLRSKAISFIPSQSNFILLFPEDSSNFDELFRSSGIGARSFESSANISGARRVTLPGNTEAFARLLFALETFFQSQSLES